MEKTRIYPRGNWFMILGFNVAMIVLIALSYRKTGLLIPVIIISIIDIILLPIILSEYIVMDEQGLTAYTLIKKKEIKWSSIHKMYVNYVSKGRGGVVCWFFETEDTRLGIDISLYSKKKIKLIAQTIVTNCLTAIIDEKIREAAKSGKILLR